MISTPRVYVLGNFGHNVVNSCTCASSGNVIIALPTVHPTSIRYLLLRVVRHNIHVSGPLVGGAFCACARPTPTGRTNYYH